MEPLGTLGSLRLRFPQIAGAGGPQRRTTMLLRELGIREVVFEPQFTGPERTVFPEELMGRQIQP